MDVFCQVSRRVMLVFYFSMEFPMPSLTSHGLTSFKWLISSFLFSSLTKKKKKKKFLITYMKCSAGIAHSIYVIDI